MRKEPMGAFIDAVYAIAITILALEAPTTLDEKAQVAEFAAVIGEYAIAFTILFALWIQHRRLNQMTASVSRPQLWLHGLFLLTVCLIPRATSLVFHYGGVGELMHVGAGFESGISRAMLVDLFYCCMVFVADMGLLGLMWLSWRDPEAERDHLARCSKLNGSAILLVALGVALLTSLQNRYFGLMIPLALIFEVELAKLIFKYEHRPA